MNVHALPAPSARPRWMLAAPLVLLALPLLGPLVAWSLANLPAHFVNSLAVDWPTFTGVAASPNPYDVAAWRWSPVAAWLMAGVFVPLGFPLWAALHVLALALLRNAWMIGAFLIAYPFWSDLIKGNSVTFVVIAGWLALRGSRGGTIATFALAMLMPRPIALPLVVYLAWQQPWSRRWLAGIFLGHAALVLASGYGPDFVARLASTAADEVGRGIFPSVVSLLGPAWLPVAVALAAVLTRFGLVGLAGLALTPYYINNYGLVVLLDVPAVQRWLRQLGHPEARGPARRVAPQRRGARARSPAQLEGVAGRR